MTADSNTSNRVVTAGRLALLAMGGISLLTGLWGGLLRLSFALPAPQADWISLHGPLMVTGFLGTLIGLERAVGLGRRWAYSGPVATALGAGLMIAGVKGPLVPYLMIAGSLSLCAVFAYVLRLQPSSFVAILTLGSLSWLAGNVVWAGGGEISQAVLWWGAFLILTIAGERLELTRLRPMTRAAQLVFFVPVVLLLTGLSLMEWRLIGVSLFLFAAWLARFDFAWRTISQKGLVRFSGTCLLAGYGWLGTAGLLASWFGMQTYGIHYDAILHSLFVGFVFSMIFAHAPIILPAVLRVPIPFRNILYAPLVLLHLSLALRIAGDLWFGPAARRYGGALNVVSIVFFIAAVVFSAGLERRRAVGPGHAKRVQSWRLS